MSSAEQWVTLAQLLRPQGRKGEVLAELFTDFPETLAGREGLILAKEGFSGELEEARACTLTATWLPKGKNEGRIVLEIAGVTSINEAETLSGYELLVEAEKRELLDEGAAYISDLVGCAVYDGDRLVGRVSEVHFPSSADGRRRLKEATPLLMVVPEGGGEEAMIPFATEFLRSLDVEAKVIRMALPEGLLELSADGLETAES